MNVDKATTITVTTATNILHAKNGKVKISSFRRRVKTEQIGSFSKYKKADRLIKMADNTTFSVAVNTLLQNIRMFVCTPDTIPIFAGLLRCAFMRNDPCI